MPDPILRRTPSATVPAIGVRAALVVLFLLAAGAAPSGAQQAAGSDDGEGWDVTATRGETRTVSFTTSEGTWMSADLAPDGSWLVFDLLGHVYRLPVDGGEARNLTADAGAAVSYHPRVSPDGGTVAFVSDRTGQDNLWLMDADGSDPRPVFENPRVRAATPAWTPDGEYVVVRREELGGPGRPGSSGLWMYHREGGEGVELVGDDDLSGGARNPSWPSVSRDGRWLYFHVYTGPDDITSRDVLRGHWQLRRMELATGEVSEVTMGRTGPQIRASSGSGYAPEVAPDGRSLAFARRIPDGTVSHEGHRFGPRTALWIRDLETGEERVAMDPISVDAAEGIKTVRVLPGYDWSDDGRRILVSQGGQLRLLEVESGDVRTIPFEARVERSLSEQAGADLDIDDDPFRATFLRWHTASPAGDRLAFQAVGKIWTRGLPDGEPRRLTRESFDAFEFSPAWSPDGRWVAFTSWDDEAGGHVWKAPADGGEAVRLTETPAEYLHPVWSPDGSHLIVARGGGMPARDRGAVWNPRWELHRLPADGGATEKVAEASPPGGSFFARARSQVVRASFGPDGRIFFPDRMEGEGRTVTGLVSVRPDGSERRVHLTFPFADEVVVAPDGRRVAFQEGDNVYVTRLPRGGTGGDPASVHRDGGDLPVERLSTEGGLYPRWRSATRLDFGSGRRFFTRDVQSGTADTVAVDLDVPRRIPEGSLALTGARLVTLDDREVVEDGVLVVEGARIACLGPAGACDTDGVDREIDLSGKTIVPGWVDMHAHHYREHRGVMPRHDFESAVYLAYGVTANLDNSTWSQNVFPTAELIRAGEVLGPRTWSTGDPLYADDGRRQNEIDSRETAQQEVDRLASWGATAIKEYLQPRRDQRQWVVDAARDRGLMVTSEGGDLAFNVGMIVDGHTGWEHPLTYVPLHGDVTRFFGEAGAVYSPTFVVGGPGPWNEDYFYQRRDVWKDAKQRRWMPWRQFVPHMRRRTLRPETDYSFPLVAQGLAEMIEHGATGAIGSHGQAHGIAAHWEVWMAASALGAHGALEVASLHGARFLGAEGDLGSLEPGKLADLVVLDENPLEDIRATLEIDRVMQGGILYEGETLDEVWPEDRPYGDRWWVQPPALRSDDRAVDWHDRP